LTDAERDSIRDNAEVYLHALQNLGVLQDLVGMGATVLNGAKVV
jgi:hypothetical protein